MFVFPMPVSGTLSLNLLLSLSPVQAQHCEDSSVLFLLQPSTPHLYSYQPVFLLFIPYPLNFSGSLSTQHTELTLATFSRFYGAKPSINQSTTLWLQH